MKRTEIYTQTDVEVPYGEFGRECLELDWKNKYLWQTEGCVILINFERDTKTDIKDALKATLDIMPPTAEIPRELSDLLNRNKFVRRD